MNMERTVTLHGNTLHLTGNDVKAGDQAPDFFVLANNMTPKKLSDFAGKTIILSTVPSLDTPVCDTETRRFNSEAAKLGPEIVVLTVSMDLPFAQARWCGAAGIDKVVTLSDHRDASLGQAYGVLIKELRLLARKVFIIDKSGTIRYQQLVPEISSEPDYGDVLAALKKIM